MACETQAMPAKPFWSLDSISQTNCTNSLGLAGQNATIVAHRVSD